MLSLLTFSVILEDLILPFFYLILSLILFTHFIFSRLKILLAFLVLLV